MAAVNVMYPQSSNTAAADPDYAVPMQYTQVRPRAHTDSDVMVVVTNEMRDHSRDEQTGHIIVDPSECSMDQLPPGAQQQSTPGYSSGYWTGSSTPPVRSKFATRTGRLPSPPPFRASPTMAMERETWANGNHHDMEDVNPYASVQIRQPLSKSGTHYNSTPLYYSTSHTHQYPATGQIRLESAAAHHRVPTSVSRTSARRGETPQPGLTALMKRMKELDLTVRRQLARADNHLMAGELDKAISFLEAGLLQTDGFPHLQSLLWMLLGSAHTGLGQHKKASVCHLHHLAYCRELNNFRGLTKAECNLGIAYMKLGFYKLAGRCFLQYLENCRVMRDDLGISVACSNLGLLSRTMASEGYTSLMKQGDHVQAQEILNSNVHRAIAYFEQHLELAEQFGDIEKQGHAYGNLGNCYEILRQYTQAIFCHNKRLEIVRSTGDRTSECCTLCNLGNCFRATGKLQEAMQYYQLNLDLTRSIGDSAGEIVTLLNLGATCELTNKLEEAVEWYTLYLSKMVESRDIRGQAKGLSTLAGLYQDTGQIVKAHEYYQKLVDVFQQLGDKDAHAAALHYLREIKQAIKREKMQTKKSNKSLRRRAKSAGKSRTISRASGVAMQQSQRAETPVGKMATWTPSQRAQFQLNTRRVTTSDSFSSTLVFEDPATAHLQEQYRYRVEVAAQRSEAGYHSQWMNERLRRGEGQEQALSAATADQTNLIYSMYHYRETPVPSNTHSPSNLYTSSESFAELRRLNQESGSESGGYESIREGATHHFRGHDVHSSCSTLPDTNGVPGDQRHFEELRKLSTVFTSAGTLSPLGVEEGTDKEWEQWLLIQDEDALSNVGSLNVDMNAFSGRRSLSPSAAYHPIRQAISAPHVDFPEEEEDYVEATTPL